MNFRFAAAGLMLIGLLGCAGRTVGGGSDDWGNDPADRDPAHWVQLYTPADTGMVPARREPVDKISTVDLDNHFKAMEAIWSARVERVDELMRLAPYTLRYEIDGGRVACPYLRFLKLMMRWTSVDDRNTYWSGEPGIARRHFAMEEWTRRDDWQAGEFQKQWAADLPRIVSDMQYIQAWYDQRKGSLVSGPLYRYDAPAGTTRPSPEKAQLRLVLIHSVVYDPRYDKCDYKTYLHEQYGIEAK